MGGLFIIPLILGVAYATLADRKGLAILQRRLGPETVGLLGVLQPFSDAIKLLTKELIHVEGTKPLLSAALPVVTLGCNLGGYAFLPLAILVTIVDFPYHTLATIGLIGLGVHGVLYVAWGATNSFSFLGGVRTVSQLVSYELTLSATLLFICLDQKELNYNLLLSSSGIN